MKITINRVLLFAPAAVILLWLTWLTLALYGGSFDLPILSGRDFSALGQFGDSFGGLTALMSALAAAGALAALRTQQIENARQSFDSVFFATLNYLTQIVSATDVQEYADYQDDNGNVRTELNREFVGRDAFKAMLEDLRERLAYADADTRTPPDLAYKKFYSEWNDDLGHYFRTLYHLFRLIDDRRPRKPMFYARIARAQLSNSELFLLGYNCIYGEGKEKFSKYLADFRLLHNIDFSGVHSREWDLFLLHLPRDSFGRHTQICFASPPSPSFATKGEKV